MKNRWIWIGVVVAVVVLAAIWLMRRGGEPTAVVDLIQQYDTAEKRSTLPLEQAFRIIDVTIDGVTKKSIFAHPTSRVIFRLTVPRDAWLRAAIALVPEAWEAAGNGVLFRIGVSDGRTYDELLNQHIDPLSSRADRRWFPVQLDLSPYAEQQVEIILNTNSSPPRQPDDSRNDWSVWGQPEIYVQP